MPLQAGAATSQFWNAGGTGGNGVWGTGPADTNWNTSVGAPSGTNQVWPGTANDIATFQDAVGGTVTVFGTVSAAAIVENGASYTLQSGTIHLIQGPAAAQPSISVQTGTLTVNSLLTGSAGLVKTGAGNVILSNNETYTGTTAITAGTLTLTGSLSSTTANISAGATLTDANGGLASATVVTNAGTLTVNAADTVATYTQNGGGALAGPGTLTVTTATLNGGMVSGSLLGNTTSTGTVLVSGSLGGGTLSVTGGTLTLTGTSTNGTVDISAGASLVDSNGGLISTAAVTNAGTFSVGGGETVATYTQNSGGFLPVGSTLTATTVMLNGGTVSGGLLGDITSTGTVFVSGSLGGGPLSVTGGTLTLSGSSTNATVGISAGASLIDSNGGLIATAAVTNAGTLTANAADTVDSYIQNGTGILSGSGSLTATTATLNGGTVSGTLLGQTTSTGTVLVSGFIGGGSLSVTSGILTLTGTSTNATVGISAGASLIDTNAGLASSASVTNAGTLTVNSTDFITSYIQNNAGVLNGTSALIATTATLNGGTISGNLQGSTTSTGNVLVSGTIGGGSLSVTGGTLTLTGASTNAAVGISSAATLVVSNSGLSSGAAVTNAGTLTANSHTSAATYLSNGGTLNGTGTFSVTSAALNNGSSVDTDMAAGHLTSDGTVSITGHVDANTIEIASGTLTNTGTLGDASNHLDIASGATLVANGIQGYGLFTTSGAGTATWQGNLANTAILAPGAVGGTGILQVNGNFSQSSSGTLKLDVSSGLHDQLLVTGTASFGGALELNQAGSVTPFVAIHVVDAAAYTGNFTSISENLNGAVWFNPSNGDVTLISQPSPTRGATLFGTTPNQTSTWIALYDDVIDPGITNITPAPGSHPPYTITSGIADIGNPDLLAALSASITPTGLNAALLNRLSPEVYTSFSDYAIQATRTHQRTALAAPAVAPAGNPDWELFAATDFFNAETDSSRNLANYELNGAGFLAGARTTWGERAQLAAYLAADTGTVQGELIRADVTGWSIGALGKTSLDEQSRTFLTGGISYGRYSFDGTRGSASATNAGWQPGLVNYSDVDSDALELFLGIETTVYRDEHFRLIPSAGLRYVTGTMDDFTEITGASPGSPIALKVGKDHYQSTLAEMALRAETNLTPRLMAWGQAGFNLGLGDDPHALTATFATGSRPLRAEADGLTRDLLFLGLGGEYRLTEAISLGIGYRAEFRPSHPAQQSCNLSSTFRF